MSISGNGNGGRKHLKTSRSNEKSRSAKRSIRRKSSAVPINFISGISLTVISLERQEDEFETKLDFDNFLELREELIMNLVLRTDVAATNRKLKEYAVANGIKTDATEASNEPNAKAVKRKDVAPDAADPSGLIKGLKKLTIPKALAPYDPFMGMPQTRDYYLVQESYVTRARGKPADAMVAGGYDFDQYMDESLLRAFAGLGVFIEDEMAAKDNVPVPIPGSGQVKVSDDVF